MSTTFPDGARFVLSGLPGHTLTRPLSRRLERRAFAGVVLFSRNVESPSQVHQLNARLRNILGPSALIAVDQEGGRVARLRAPFTEWPPMRRFGEANSVALARAAGRVMGRELAVAGFNCNFAPVLDVDSNPRNPVIGDRSFGSDPRVVARLGLAFARGLEDAGILPCGKHFPGHGDTALDSHLTLPEVGRSLRELRRIELAPFRRAVAAGLPMLMSAHVRYPALDPERPATLSRRILRDLLRRELGFRGVVVSDDLSMHALDDVGSIGEAAVAALSAGCDLLLACESLDAAEEAAAAVTAAVRAGRIPERRIREALRRVDRLRRWLERRPRPTESLDDVLRCGDGMRVIARLERRLAATSTGDGRASRQPRRRHAVRPRRRARDARGTWYTAGGQRRSP